MSKRMAYSLRWIPGLCIGFVESKKTSFDNKQFSSKEIRLVKSTQIKVTFSFERLQVVFSVNKHAQRLR